jgi:hypothetical protein
MTILLKHVYYVLMINSVEYKTVPKSKLKSVDDGKLVESDDGYLHYAGIVDEFP